MAVGLGLDPSGRLVFVSGGGTGQGWVYDTATGTEVATLPLTGEFDFQPGAVT